MKDVFVFVYGSLKKGFNNHRLIEPYVQRFLGKRYVKGTLYSLGHFPGLKLSGIDNIKGELYQISWDGLKCLDRLEGFKGVNHPANLYNRKLVPLYVDGKFQPCWVYEFNGDVEKYLYLKHGEWV